MDTRLRLTPKARIVESAHADLLVLTAASLKSLKARRLQTLGVELVSVKSLKGKIDLGAVLKELGKREILSVLLESGPSLNASALAANIVQKLVLFFAPKIGGKTPVPFVHAPNSVSFPPLNIKSVQQFGPDVAIEATLRRSAKT
jgi:diaminohydroxyphosphoribosylaminopyrimidine deaminase / 5-amino-6-(5-phosphoribosylamino)uracil reductase